MGMAMNANLSQILMVGSGAVLVAVAALFLLVRRDLAPAGAFGGALDGGGRWFLGAALGSGVIAVTIKLVIISAIAAFPDRTIAPLLRDPAETRARILVADVRPSAIPDPPPIRRAVWSSLPQTPPTPAGNPTTLAKVALGERLFHDPMLSADGKVACSSCHDVADGAGDDRRATAIGITAVPGRRNSPTVFNVAFQARLFWDGRAASLEEQALGPLVNPDEMGMPSLAAVEDKVKADPAYRDAFDQAFGDGSPITIERIAQAIAAFERTLVTADTGYDRFIRGDDEALTEAQKRGMWLFESLGCATCHSGPNFSGASNVGPRSPYSALLAARSELGRRYGLSEDKGKAAPESRDGVWRIPSLRNVALTAPYFHNGSVKDLSEAVRVMAATQLDAAVGDRDSGERTRLWWSPETASFSRFERRSVSDRDVEDIVAFLHALSSERLAERPARKCYDCPRRGTRAKAG